MLGHCLLTEIMLWYKLLSPSRSALTAFPGLIRAALRLFAWQTRRLWNGPAKKQKWLQHGRRAVVHQMPHSIMHLFPADVVTVAGSWGSCTSTGLDLHRWNDGRVEGGLLVTSSVVERSLWAPHDYRCTDIDTIIRYWYWYQGVLHLYSWKLVNATTLTPVLCQSIWQFCLVCFGTAVAALPLPLELHQTILTQLSTCNGNGYIWINLSNIAKRIWRSHKVVFRLIHIELH